MTTDVNENLLAWLKDAHAMERTMAGLLSRHAERSDARTAIRPRLADHAETSRRHATMIERVLAGHGVEPADLANWTGGLKPRIQALMTGSNDQTAVYDTEAVIAAEHFVIACYHGLRAAAEALDDQAAVRVCDEILADETAMGLYLERHLRDVTRTELDRSPPE
jgi:ferritin-like metal-binding protein YciE